MSAGKLLNVPVVVATGAFTYNRGPLAAGESGICFGTGI
jgi:hypothetical protein